MDKRLIFCCTSGRSGTAYLAALMSLIPGVYSTHEGKPSFTDWYWRTKNVPIADRELVYNAFWKHKLRAISTVKEDVYSETSHMTFKGSIHYLPKDIKYSVIFLERDHREVARSLYMLNDIPGRTKTGRRNCFYPGDPDNVIAIDCNWAGLTDYQLCYWYVKEMQARADDYWKSYKDNPNVIAIKVDVSQLKDLFTFNAILELLELPRTVIASDFARVVAARHNTKLNRKQLHDSSERYRSEEKEINELIS